MIETPCCRSPVFQTLEKFTTHWRDLLRLMWCFLVLDVDILYVCTTDGASKEGLDFACCP